MLNLRVTSCKECALVSNLIDSIDCQLAKMANNLYLNIAYMLDKPVEGCKMSTLLHYKRILQHKSINEEWAIDHSIEDIASRVNALTVGCKCCGKETVSFENALPTIPSTILTFYTAEFNTELLTPFHDFTAESLPYIFSIQNGTEFLLPDDPAYVQTEVGSATFDSDLVSLLSSQSPSLEVSMYYQSGYIWYSNPLDKFYKFVVNIVDFVDNRLEIRFRNSVHDLTGLDYRYIIQLENDNTVTTSWEIKQGKVWVATGTEQIYDKDFNPLSNNFANTPLIQFQE